MSIQRGSLNEAPIPYGGWKCLFKTLIILTGVFLVIATFRVSFIWKVKNFNASVGVCTLGLVLIVWQLWLNPTPYFRWLRDYRNRNIRKRFVWIHDCNEFRTSPAAITIQEVSVPVLEHLGHNPRSCHCWEQENDFLEIRYQVSGWGRSSGMIYYRGHYHEARFECRLDRGINVDGRRIRITDQNGDTRMYSMWTTLNFFLTFMRFASRGETEVSLDWDVFDRAVFDDLSALQEARSHGRSTLTQVKGVICAFDAKDRLPYGKEGCDIRRRLSVLLECASAGYETVDPELLETPQERRQRERKAARSRRPIEVLAV